MDPCLAGREQSQIAAANKNKLAQIFETAAYGIAGSLCKVIMVAGRA